MCYYNTSRKGQSYLCLSQYSIGSSACQPLSEKIMKLIHEKLYHNYVQIARYIFIYSTKNLCTNCIGKISKIAQGIPIGTDLEYLDELTLQLALNNRKDIS